MDQQTCGYSSGSYFYWGIALSQANSVVVFNILDVRREKRSLSQYTFSPL